MKDLQTHFAEIIGIVVGVITIIIWLYKMNLKNQQPNNKSTANRLQQESKKILISGAFVLCLIIFGVIALFYKKFQDSDIKPITTINDNAKKIALGDSQIFIGGPPYNQLIKEYSIKRFDDYSSGDFIKERIHNLTPKIIITGEGYLLSINSENQLKIWFENGSEETKTLDFGVSTVKSYETLIYGNFFVLGGERGEILFVSISENRIRGINYFLTNSESRINDIDLSRTLSKLIACNSAGQIFEFNYRDYSTDEPIRVINTGIKYLLTIGYDRDNRIYTASQDKDFINLWGISEEGIRRRLSSKKENGEWYSYLNFSHRNYFLLAGTTGGTLEIWDYHNGDLLKQINCYGEKERVDEIVVNQSGFLATSSASGIIKVWDINNFTKSFLD